MKKHDTNEELTTLKRIELLLEIVAKTAVADKLAKIFKEKSSRSSTKTRAGYQGRSSKKGRGFPQARFRACGVSGSEKD